ncbi:MAG: hypothetical protein J5787_05725 [Alphaproteobacteria bacterium]|nr:hypothetical protein [Alphaproteobacteria bacterium]MBO4644363.1 hypothetical protein [Alphaproteobacteria bacterium]
MSIELFINIVVICLLVPTIVFAVVLNKRLEILRNSRADLGRLIEAFNDATTRAESGIPKLKQAADSAGGLLRDQIQKAQTLRDDMAFMIERAETAAQRLEKAMNAAPKTVRSDNSYRQEQEPAPAPVEKTGRSRKKKVLAENPEDLISSAVSAAQDILRDTEGNHSSKPEKRFSAFPEEDFGTDRSEAERELLKALQSMR